MVTPWERVTDINDVADLVWASLAGLVVLLVVLVVVLPWCLATRMMVEVVLVAMVGEFYFLLSALEVEQAAVVAAPVFA